jgi:hypothetical protein
MPAQGGGVTVAVDSQTARLQAAEQEIADLRADRDHVLVTARQAATAAAHERQLRERLTARLAAVDRYISTARMPHRMRRELVALLHGHHEQA